MIFFFILSPCFLQIPVHAVNVIWLVETPSGFEHKFAVVKKLAGDNIPADVSISSTSLLGTEADSDSTTTIMYALYKKQDESEKPYFFAAYHSFQGGWEVIENPVEGSKDKLASSERLFGNISEAQTALKEFNPGNIGNPPSDAGGSSTGEVTRDSGEAGNGGNGDVGNSGSAPPNNPGNVVRSTSDTASSDENSQTGDRNNAGNPEGGLRGFLNKTNVHGRTRGEILKNGMMLIGGLYGTLFVFGLATQLIS